MLALEVMNLLDEKYADYYPFSTEIGCRQSVELPTASGANPFQAGIDPAGEEIRKGNDILMSARLLQRGHIIASTFGRNDGPGVAPRGEHQVHHEPAHAGFLSNRAWRCKVVYPRYVGPEGLLIL